VFQPKLQPPEQSERLKVLSFARGEPVKSTAGPRVCGAPGPSLGRPTPSISVTLLCSGASGSRMYGKTMLLWLAGRHLFHTVPWGVKNSTMRLGIVWVWASALKARSAAATSAVEANRPRSRREKLMGSSAG